MKKIFFIAILSLFLGFGEAHAARGDIAAPTSPSPADGATVEQPVTLKWSTVEFPAGLSGGYILEANGGNMAALQKWVPDTSFALNLALSNQTLLVNTVHQWRVRACFGFDIPTNQETQCGPWSNNGVFWKFTPTLAKPTLLSPPNTIKAPTFFGLDSSDTSCANSVRLKWEKVVGAASYQVTLRNTSANLFTKVFETGIDNTPADPSEPSLCVPTIPQWLSLQNSYAWKVAAKQGNTLGPVSDEWQFFLTLAKPTLLTPANGEDVPYPVPTSKFTWSPVVGATKYILEVFDAANLKLSSLSSINKIGEKYAWQVTACEKENVNCGPPSSRSNFTLVFASPIVSVPSATQEIPWPFNFAWQKPASPPSVPQIKYIWEIKEGISTKLSGETTSKEQIIATGTLSGQLKSGSYTFLVKACTQDVKGCSAWGGRFFSISDNEVPTTQSFNVTPQPPNWVNIENPNVTISWIVSDTGGSGLKQIALQIAPDNNGNPGTWQVVPGKNTIAPTTKTMSDSPASGNWWYRILVLDGKLNEAFSNAIKTQVDKDAPGRPECSADTKFLKSVLVTCSKEAGATIYYTLNKQAPSRGSSQYRESLTFTTATTLTVAAWDLAGNRSQAPDNSYTYTLEVLSGSNILIDPKPDDLGGVVLDFGKVEVGASAEKSLTITNNSPGDIAVSLPFIPEPFSWEKSAIIIAKGETKVVSVKFTPQRVGPFSHDVDIELRDLAKGSKPLLRFVKLTLRGEGVDTQPPTIEVGHTKVPGEEKIVINAGAQDINGVKKITISLGVGAANPGPLATETICLDSSRSKCVTTAAPVGSWSNGTKIVYYATAEDLSGNITKSAEQRFTAGKIPDTSTSAPTGIFRVVDRAVNVAFTALLIAASFFVLLAAFQFASGGGNPEQISQARDKLIWAAAGIGIALVAKGAAVILQNILLGPSEKGPGPCPGTSPSGGGGIENPLKTICFSGLLDSIINVIFTLSLIVVPFVVIYAGFLFVTGGGNPEQITKARNTLIWTAVGFGVILIAKGLPFILKDILGI